MAEAYSKTLMYTKILLMNFFREYTKSINAKVLADTGGLYQCIPNHNSIQFELVGIYKPEVRTVDGKKHPSSHAGPVALKFVNRGCFTRAFVMGTEVSLRCVSMGGYGFNCIVCKADLCCKF